MNDNPEAFAAAMEVVYATGVGYLVGLAFVVLVIVISKNSRNT